MIFEYSIGWNGMNPDICNVRIMDNQATLDIRSAFPILSRTVNGKPLVYLDNAASTQKPTSVIQRVSEYYSQENANVHRGVHKLSQIATDAFEDARNKVVQFIGAKEAAEVIFTSGTTDGINLVAQTWGRANIKAGDEILISSLEHHSNIVPWQMLCEEKDALLKVLPIHPDGSIQMEMLDAMISERTKLVAVGHVSNALGTVNDIETIISKAHTAGAKVLVDGAQAVAHIDVDVKKLDCDFYVFSGHKLYGPTGIGVLYGKKDILNNMPPWRGGGEMIRSVSFSKSTYHESPFRFEAGTPNIAGSIGLGAAIDFMNSLDLLAVRAHEDDLLDYTTSNLLEIPGMRLVGTASNKIAVISFLLDHVHPYDVGVILDQLGVAVRTGHHCAEPLMNLFEIPGTVRASFSVYNTMEDADRLIEAVKKAASLLS